ncbi:hypothetical protein [Agromyces humi]|uniref:hypothetical protein n=1 Tax=Agromyces humi TaxID=1766800 RepID=UPI00135ADB93|nr:hypothetical protein [Agromyces humi]
MSTEAWPWLTPGVRTTAWSVAGVGAAVAIAALGWIDPVIPFAAVAGIILLAVAVFLPKLFALLAIVTIVLTSPIQSALGAAGSYADEAVVLLAFASFSVRRFVTDRRLVYLPGLPWFGLFIAMGVLGGMVNRVAFGTMSEAMLLILKGLIFAFALAQLRWTVRDLRLLARIGAVAVIFFALTGVINLVAPGVWSSLISGDEPVTAVMGVPALSGPFQHPAAFSRFCAVLAIALIAYGLIVRASLGNAILLLVTGGLAVLTFQVKTIIGLGATAGLLLLRYGRPVMWIAILCVVPIIGVVIVPPLYELIAGDFEIYVVQDSARSALTLGSLSVAAHYFPLGAGFGRYGSYTAGATYSPEYVELGFTRIYGLGRGDAGMFLNDTQWPAILGESGWLGAAFFAAGIIAILVSLCRPTSPDEPTLVKWLRVTGIGWLLVLLIESVAAPVFVSAPSYPFVFAAAGMIASFRDSARIPGLRLPRTAATPRPTSVRSAALVE